MHGYITNTVRMGDSTEYLLGRQPTFNDTAASLLVLTPRNFNLQNKINDELSTKQQ